MCVWARWQGECLSESWYGRLCSQLQKPIIHNRHLTLSLNTWDISLDITTSGWGNARLMTSHSLLLKVRIQKYLCTHTTLTGAPTHPPPHKTNELPSLCSRWNFHMAEKDLCLCARVRICLDVGVDVGLDFWMGWCLELWVSWCCVVAKKTKN